MEDGESFVCTLALPQHLCRGTGIHSQHQRCCLPAFALTLTLSLTLGCVLGLGLAGYIPCPEGIECGMPTQWFPEYSKPLGPPLGPATTDPTRTVWSRRFEHATVSVDLRDRTASKIAWDS